jgi:hypothetical protein
MGIAFRRFIGRNSFTPPLCLPAAAFFCSSGLACNAIFAQMPCQHAAEAISAQVFFRLNTSSLMTHKCAICEALRLLRAMLYYPLFILRIDSQICKCHVFIYIPHLGQ